MAANAQCRLLGIQIEQGSIEQAKASDKGLNKNSGTDRYPPRCILKRLGLYVYSRIIDNDFVLLGIEIFNGGLQSFVQAFADDAIFGENFGND